MVAFLTTGSRPHIRYVASRRRTGVIFYGKSERDKSYWPGDDHEVMITDLRTLAEAPSLERNGFTMLREPTAMRDYLDSAQIDQVLYPEAIGLAKRLNSAAHAIAFGPVARSDSPNHSQSRLPAFGAHVDYGRRTIEDMRRGPSSERRRITGG